MAYVAVHTLQEVPLQVRLAYLAVVLSLAASPSPATNPGSVCSRPEVLDMVAEMLARRGTPALIEAGVGEIPTREANTVQCAVRLNTRFYDTDRYGYVPQYRAATFQYLVRTGQNGLFVTAADGLD